MQNFRCSPKKEGLCAENRQFSKLQTKKKKRHDLGHFLTNQKVVLSSVEDRGFSRTCRLRDQGKRLDLRGQRLENVSSRTHFQVFGLEGQRLGLEGLMTSLKMIFKNDVIIFKIWS